MALKIHHSALTVEKLNKIESWTHEKLQAKCNFVACEFSGLPSTEDPTFDVLNCVFMYEKYYINSTRSNN